jgi:hypothetical protein
MRGSEKRKNDMNETPSQLEPVIDLNRLSEISLVGIEQPLAQVHDGIANFDKMCADEEPIRSGRMAEKLSRELSSAPTKADSDRIVPLLHDAEKMERLCGRHPARLASDNRLRIALNEVFTAMQPVLAHMRSFAGQVRLAVEASEDHFAKLFCVEAVPSQARKHLDSFDLEIAGIERTMHRHATLPGMPPILPDCLRKFGPPGPAFVIDPTDIRQSVRIRATQAGVATEAQALVWEYRRPWRVAESQWRRTHPGQRPGTRQFEEWEWRCKNVGKTPTSAQFEEWDKLAKSAASQPGQTASNSNGTPAPTVAAAYAAGPIGEEIVR